MSRVHSLWFFIRRHKYAVVIVCILLMVGLVDENSYFNRYHRWIRIRQLHSEIVKYKDQYEQADKSLRELQSNPRTVEKLVREKYFMKRANEDVFVIQKPVQEQSDSTELTEDQQ